MIKVKSSKLKDVKIIEYSIFEDFRGHYIETYNEELYRKNNINIKFIQDDVSISSRNVLRGLHGDHNTWKLITCLEGKFILAVVNCDKSSKYFGKWETFTLSDSNKIQILVPPKYANGHLVLSEKAIFHYKQSTYYKGAKKQFTYKWDDPFFNIGWPINDPILSIRDKDAKYIKI